MLAGEHVFVGDQDVLLLISAMYVYSTGCAFGVSLQVREDDFESWDPSEISRGVRLGLVWPDGSEVLTSQRSGGLRRPAGPLLLLHGVGGSPGSYSYQYWLWPLPPLGAMTLVADGPQWRIGKQRLTLNSEDITRAGERVVRIWDDDRPEPPLRRRE
jgi:hypothetical protein